MIENIRKYTGLMIVVFVLLFLGLLFMQGGSNQAGGSGPVVLTAHGTAYPQTSYRRLGENPVRLLQELSGNSFQARIALLGYLYEMASSNDSLPSRDGLDARRYLVNRVSLQNGAKKFGLHASDTEIDEFMRESIFVSNTGDFDEAAYQEFVDKRLARLGMGKKDLYDTLGDVLVFQRLGELLGTGLKPSREALQARVENGLQQIDYQLVEFKASTYEALEDPTEAEVKEFWENNKGRYLADPLRKLSYIIAKPDFESAIKAQEKAAAEAAAAAPPIPAEPETPAEPEAQDNTEAPQVAPPEEIEEPVTPAEPAAPVAPVVPATPPITPGTPVPLKPTESEIPLSPDQQEDVIGEAGNELDNLWVSVQEAEGENLLKLAKEAGYIVLTTSLIKQDDLPAVLRGPIRDRSVTGSDAIFGHRYPGATAMDRISDVIRIGDNWIIYRIEGSKDAVELSYEDSKADARLDLIKERAYAAMTKAAEEAREKLVAATTAEKSFADAAKELALTPTVREKISGRIPDLNDPTPREIFNLVSKVNPSEISDVLTQTDEDRAVFRSVFAYIDKRELVEDDQLRNSIEQQLRNQESTIKRLAFSNWLSQQYAAAGVTFPKRP